MKLILDARKINDFGIGEYIKNIFVNIAKSEEFQSIIITRNNKGSNLFENNQIINANSLNYSISEHFEIPFKVSKFKEYSYFSPHYIFPWSKINNSIVTVHDLIHFKFPEYFKPKIKTDIAELFIKKIRRSSKIIFTVSENTKKDMIEMFDFTDDQIKVVYNGLNDLYFYYPKGKRPVKEKYILYTGNIKPHKNILALIEAFRIIHGKYKEVKLVLAGAGEKLPEYFLSDDIEDFLITTGYLDRKLLIDYIDHAEFFVFPSFYEGFGFPPLEAMSRGKAVISSPEGSLKEILGDAALYFNPHSPVELTEKIELFLNNSSLRSDYEAKGRARSEKFRVQTSVNKYIKIIKQLAR